MPSILLGLTLAATCAPFELTTLDEQTVRGELVGLSNQTATLRTDEGEMEFSVAELLSLSPVAPTADEFAQKDSRHGDIFVQFAEGSSTPATGYAVDAGKATISLPGGEAITVAARRIRAVRFLEQEGQIEAQWNDIVAHEPNGDVVVVRKGGDGQPVTLDYLEGALRDVSESTVEFEFEGDVIPVNRAKVTVEGLLYYQTDRRSKPDPLCRVEQDTGAQWIATAVRLSEGGLEFTTAEEIDRVVPLPSVKHLDFSLGKIVFLSDLEPVQKSWRPYLGSVSDSDGAHVLFDVRRDQDFSGEPLIIGERKFRKGLAIHSRTEISYRLPGQFSRFAAVVAIDPKQKHRGHVRLEVRGDNRVLFESAIDGGDEPKPLELDVTGVGRLTILVDFGQRWDIGDQLLMGGARVIR